MITAIGHFNAWKLPDYPGIENYQGHLRHASNWDPTFDPTGKTIATIGNEASGIQVTTALQQVVKRLGSASHLNHIRWEPRWEHFVYKYGDPDKRNRFGYFGNGWTKKKTTEGSDMTGHLKKQGEVDLRTYDETWFNA